MADKDEADSTEESGTAADDASEASANGSQAIEPAVDGVPADADEPTFRDRERMAAEADASDDHDPDRPDPDTDDDGEPRDGERELVTVGAPARDKQAGADDAVVVPRGRQKKTEATARRKQPVDKERRTGPVKFLKESISELQKVVYPTGNQLVNYFVVVLIFVLFIIAIVSVLDFAFGKAIIAIFS